MYKYVNYCGLGLVGCCFRSRQGFIPGSGNMQDSNEKDNVVILDTSHMGNEVVIVKNGRRICGAGSALANVDIAQDKAYYEAKIQTIGGWSIGVASMECNLNTIPLGKDEHSWVLGSDGTLMHANVSLDQINLSANEGDYIGCSFDHVELNFFLNGKNLHCPIRGIKGKIRPIISVEDGCIIDVNFDKFVFPPPPGFQKLMVEIDLL